MLATTNNISPGKRLRSRKDIPALPLIQARPMRDPVQRHDAATPAPNNSALIEAHRTFFFKPSFLVQKRPIATFCSVSTTKSRALDLIRSFGRRLSTIFSSLRCGMFQNDTPATEQISSVLVGTRRSFSGDESPPWAAAPIAPFETT